MVGLGEGRLVAVLGRVVEVVSGKSLRAFFREEIFDPVGMSDATDFFVAPRNAGRLSTAYVTVEDDSKEMPNDSKCV